MPWNESAQQRGAFQRMAGAGENGDVGTAEFGGVERVAGGLGERTLPATTVMAATRTSGIGAP